MINLSRKHSYLKLLVGVMWVCGRVLWLLWNSTLCCGFGCAPHDKPVTHLSCLYVRLGCVGVSDAVVRVPRVIFEVVQHLLWFVGTVPMINPS